MKVLPTILSAGLALVGAWTISSCAPQGKRAFDHADANDDNQLSVAEVEIALAEAIFLAGDANGDGVVTFEEWKLIYPKADPKKNAAHNTDGQPGLTLAETTVALEKNGAFEKLMAKIDTDGDGVVSKNEAGAFYDAFQAAEGETDLEKLESYIES